MRGHRRCRNQTDETLPSKKQEQKADADNQAQISPAEKAQSEKESQSSAANETVDADAILQAGIQDVINTVKRFLSNLKL